MTNRFHCWKAPAATTPDTPASQAQADALQTAAQDGTPFCEDCAAAETAE
jgi:hypothetical protein